MRSIQIQESFGLQQLKFNDCSEKPIHDDEIEVSMHAASLNYRDLLMVKGLYDPKQPLPLVPCSDGAGVVTATGKDVCDVAVGDFVTTVFAPYWQSGTPTTTQMRGTMGGPIHGALTQRFVAKSSHVMKAPKHLNAVEASTLPCAAVTAWNALVEVAKIKAGDKVLIQGTGGVALFALQFSKICGAETVVLSSSDEKLQKVKEMGASHTINYRTTPKWSRAVRDCVGQVDIVIELGGAKTLEQSLKVCRPGATIAVIGILSGIKNEINLLPIIMNKINMSGILVGSRSCFESMNKAIAHHKLQPVIDKTFAFSETIQAFEYMESAAHFGKICIDLQK
ncbi:zinc-dependent alcohol dehydrogenase family protein [Candidatus Uabimicrobium amorphum]|uniref:NADPH:quinone oxidoreductase n=1 Tax=Uabimicrobium amorphum TaxID=2596890 RepID=A0A5S9IHX2_UABAM|nr:NAD(P)-dependent alcohol dehydrogenase [Candidatus Uabimicrobium amorphum]BBM81796.1 NADPH:quinone oxidoreductase [Candidatus Uabimicrobium amorphum]